MPRNYREKIRVSKQCQLKNGNAGKFSKNSKCREIAAKIQNAEKLPTKLKDNVEKNCKEKT